MRSSSSWRTTHEILLPRRREAQIKLLYYIKLFFLDSLEAKQV